MLELPADCLATVRKLIARHAPDCEVRAFGSRVTGGARPHSDLDLAFLAPHRLSPDRLQTLREAFEESDLPIRVDVVDWHELPQGLRDAIDAAHEVVRRPGEVNLANP